MEFTTGVTGSALIKLGELLKEQRNLQKGVIAQVESLRRELEAMDAALRKVAEVPRDQLDEEVRLWARDVRELSYDIEDAIDTFVVPLDALHLFKYPYPLPYPLPAGTPYPLPYPYPPTYTSPYPFEKKENLFREGNARRQIANTIEDLNMKIQELANRRDRYKVDSIVATPTAVKPIDHHLWALYTEATELVGIHGKRDEELIKMLFEGDDMSKKKLKVVSVLGLGGVGKTTLVRAVKEKIKGGFDCWAFVSFGRNCDVTKVLKNILLDLDKRKYMKEVDLTVLDESQLIDEVQEFLKNKRYLVIIDDVWDEKLWKVIRCAFSNENNLGSRLITTTRKVSVSKACCSSSGDIVYKMKPLSADDSQRLFYRRIFSHTNGCPPELEQVSRDILKKCGGVPLNIITIANLLAGNNQIKTENQWYFLLNSIGHGLTEDYSVEEMQRILSFSYYDLPSHLKICLLYLSIFPEDYEIKRDDLIWRWIAEGFVQCEKPQTSLFELGESYFNELINRSMIQPVYGDGYLMFGSFMSCRVHDMVLDLIRSLSSDENFVTVLDGIERSTTNSQSKVRRLSLQNTPSKEDQSTALDSVSQVRSITVFAPATNLMPSLSRFDVLRVLDLSGCDLEESSHLNVGDVEYLFHLRYLGLRGTGIRKLPAEIGNLQFLQVLDVRDNYDLKELPSIVVNLRRLMCLHFDNYLGLPDGLGNLTSMEMLGFFSTRKSPNIVKELRNLIRLRELRIKLHGVSLELEEAFVESVCSMHNIQRLDLWGCFESLDLLGERWVPPQHLRRFVSLEVGEFSTLPAWIKRNPSLLSNLSVLFIKVKELWQEDLQILGRLPALRSLVISSTYQTQRLLLIGADGFHCVISFALYCKSSRQIMFQRGALPRAKWFGFNFAVRMAKNEGKGDFDFGLGNLLSLQEVYVRIYRYGATVEDARQAEAALWHASDVHRNHPTIDIEFEPKLPDLMEDPTSASLGSMGSLLGKLDVLLAPGRRLLEAVKHGMHLLKDDLEEIGACLQDLSEVEDPPLTAKCWMREVRELSYDIEDYIDNSVRPVHANKTRFVCKISPVKITRHPKRLNSHQQISNMISEFRSHVQDAIERYERYKLLDCGTLRRRSVSVGPMPPTPYEETAELVIDDRTNEFVNSLANDRDQQLKVVSFVGPECLGKTTLAKMLYNKLAGQFDCRAFVRVSRKPDMKRLFCDMLSQVQRKPPPDNSKQLDLIDNIREHLQDKRYLIIIDDLWAASVWDIIDDAFPKGGRRSRIITTTQIEDVALTCCCYRSEYVFEMTPLDYDHSRELFFNRLFGSETDCPQQFKEISNKTVEICGGLPLATVNIASLLASQPVILWEPWNDICHSLSSDLRINSTSERMRQVLNISFNNLPHHLKTCLLYLNMYPEGHTICKDDLVKQWVAEGFIDTIEGRDMEKVAGSYFDELIGRRFIQPIDINYSDEVLSCTVHDVVHDLIASKSVEENFIVVVDCYRKDVQLYDKVRRLSVRFGNAKYEKIPAAITKSQVRSLTFFGLFNCMPSITEFKLLRVLNLQLSGHRGGDTLDLTGISELFLLRYLKIACDIFIELPNHMRGLQYLETLDMDTQVVAFPWDIIHLPRLLYLRLPVETNLLDWIGNMRSVSGLSLGKLTNLHSLHLTCSTPPSDHLEGYMEALGSLLGVLGNLKTLALVPGSSHKHAVVPNASEVIISWDDLAPPLHLQRFEWLQHCCIFSGVPKWIGKLDNLCVLKIAVRELPRNEVDILTRLPALTALSLYVQMAPVQWIVFDNAGFSVLKYFKFRCSVPRLKFKEGAMPNVRKLKLRFNALGVDQLGSIPVGVEHLSGLKEISAKIGGAGAEEPDRMSAESALSNAIKMHPGRPNVNIQRVDRMFGGKDYKSSGTQEEEHVHLKKKRKIMEEDVYPESALSNTIKMHPGRPNVNIQRVDRMFGDKDDKSSGTQEEEHVPLKIKREIMEEDVHPESEKDDGSHKEDKYEGTGSFKEESNLVIELPDPERKALAQLKELVATALANGEFDLPPPLATGGSRGWAGWAPAHPKIAYCEDHLYPKSWIRHCRWLSLSRQLRRPKRPRRRSQPKKRRRTVAKPAEATPATEEAKTEEPAKEEAKDEAPVKEEEPKTEVTAEDEPKTEAPAQEEPKAEAPAQEKPKTEKPAEEGLKTEAPAEAAAEEPKAEAAAAAGSDAEEPAPAAERKEELIWSVPLVGDDERTNTVLLKFLRAREFKAKEAMAMLKAAVLWRKRFGIDALLGADLGLQEMENVVFYRGADREGHPVCYNVYGEFQDKELYEKAFGDEEKRERFLKWHIQRLERGIREQLDFSPSGICSMVQVTDLKNSPPMLGKHRAVTRQALAPLQDNYPEFITKKVFINVPWWYLAANKIMSPLLTQRTKSKFIVCSPAKSAETLFRYIAPEQVPVQFGGLYKEDDTEFSTSDAITELTIKPSSKETVEIAATENSTVVWELRVLGWEVIYGAEFTPDAEGGYTVIVQKTRKVPANEEPIMKGSFKVGEPGKIVLTVNNPASKKKKLLYRFKVKSSVEST